MEGSIKRYLTITGGLAVLVTTPALAQSIPCRMDAMICPDGSSVERTGPNCEFLPCPSATIGGSVSITGTAESGPGTLVNLDEIGFAKIPDLPLEIVPEVPVGVTFIIEHRSALDGKKVIARGLIVGIKVGAVPPNNPAYPRMGTPITQPRMTLSDTVDETERKVDVLLQESDLSLFAIGQTVDMSVTVSGNKTDAILIRN